MTQLSLYGYLAKRLAELKVAIARDQSEICEAVSKMDFKAMQHYSEKLKADNINWEELSKDVARYCTIDEIISVCKQELARTYSLEYVFNYERKVTIEERDKLKNAHYGFREAKIA